MVYFDAAVFDKLFAQNKPFVKRFTDFEEGRLSGTTTDFFYKEIAEPFVEETFPKFQTLEKMGFTYFDIRDYEKALKNKDKQDDNKLIVLYKLLSPEHLLKLPFVNDSNSLDKAFYSELLHLIGLSETKEGSKKVIGRKPEGKRDREANSKEQKREMERLIEDIKKDFESEISKNDSRVVRLNAARGKLFNLTNQQSLFDMSGKEKKEWQKQVDKQTTTVKKLETEIEEIKSNKIYENAFEWRFEFPEVLDEDGNFVGFDVVIGNPPYIIDSLINELYGLAQDEEKLIEEREL